MSITATESTRQTYNTNGALVAFSYPYPFIATSDLVVKRQIDATGVISTLVLDVDYTVGATNDDYSSGATITTTATYDDGSTLVVTRNIPNAQGTTWNDGEAFPARSTEDAMDKLTMLMQQQETSLLNTLSVADGDVLPGTIENAVDRASKFLKWDASGVISSAEATGTVTTTIGDNIYYTSDYGALSSVITAAGAVNSTVYVDSNIDAAGDTVPATIHLEFLRGGQLTGSGTVTINGSVNGPLQTLFASTLTVAGTPISVRFYPEWWGAAGDGTTVDTTAIQATIDAVNNIVLSENKTYISGALTIGSNKTLRIDGTLKLVAASAAGVSLISNSDQVGGNTDIKIIGTGVLDGNKANQTDATDAIQHTLVDIDNCDYFEFAVAKITGNYFPVGVTSSFTTAAVLVANSDYVKVHDSLATDWGREGYHCLFCNYSEMFNLRGLGSTDSWSLVQFSGDYNQCHNIFCNNAGASTMSFDCRYSTLTNVVSYNNRWQHGINFGHDGKPSDGSTAQNLVSINAGQLASKNGIQTAASTTNLSIDGVYVEGATNQGIQFSDGSSHIRLSNAVSTGNTGYGFAYFTNNTTDKSFYTLVNVDLRGNTAGTYTRLTGEISEHFSNVRMSDDRMWNTVDVTGLGSGGTLVVNNGNVTSFSRINFEALNNQAMVAQPFLKTISDGSFTIETVTNAAAGSFIRYHVL